MDVVPTIRIDETLPVDTRVALVSDVHLGDGSAGDLFGTKDQVFIDCVSRQVATADVLVVNGDAVDSVQAGDMHRIARAHPAVFSCLQSISRTIPTYYVLGNHEDVPQLREAFPHFRYVTALALGTAVCITHGHQFDMHWCDERPRGHTLARLHSSLETVLRRPIRQPFRDHDNLPNRVVHRLWFGWTQTLRLWGILRRTMGDHDALMHWRRVDNFWARGQWGDLGCIFQQAERYLRTTCAFPTLVLGHSHQPGVVPLPGSSPLRTYVNAGSWSLDSTTYVQLHHGEAIVRDARTDQSIGAERYAALLSGDELPDMSGWFRRYYRGMFRYDLDAIRRDFPPHTG